MEIALNFALVFMAPISAPESPALVSLELTGTQWEVVRIDGEKPLEMTNPTRIGFSEDYLGVGRGCYGFRAHRLGSSSEKLFKIVTDDPLIAVECAEEIKAQERKIGGIIAGATRAERPSQDRLIFTTVSGETLALKLILRE